MASMGAVAVLVLALLPSRSRRPFTLSYAVGGAQAAESLTPSPVIEGGAGATASVRFSEGTAVTFRPESRGRVLAVSARGAHIDVIEGRARAQVTPAPGGDWLFSAGPYRVEVRGTELEVGWVSEWQVFTVSLFSGKVVVRGPGIKKEVLLRPGESLLARASDGFVHVGRGREGLPASRQPNDTQRFTQALGAAADEAATGARSGTPSDGIAGAHSSLGSLGRGLNADPALAGADDHLPAREPGAAGCNDPSEPSLLALAVPDPGPVSLATCRHVDAGASGKDVRARPQGEAWVRSGPGGCLRYAEDIRGNRIPDFSNAGYHGGGVSLPRVPAAAGLARLSPDPSGDDTTAIQSALDAVGALLPDSRGFRGAVELGAGTFTLRGSLRMETGGVVLRGQGSEGPGATILRAVGAPRSVLRLGPNAKRRLASGKHTVPVTDVYVPVGARSFTLESTKDLEVGDDIVVYRPKTQRWICAIGTDVLPSKSDGRPRRPWNAKGALTFERRIVGIDGNRITVDAALTNALEKEFTQAFITRLEFPERVQEVGVEHLAAVGEFAVSGRCPSAKGEFIKVAALANGWVKNVRVQGYAGELVTMDFSSKWVTVEDATYVGQPAEASEKCDDQWAFKLGGQQNLILRGRTVGSHLTAVFTDTEIEGPNAVVDFLALGKAVRVRVASRWSTGLLFDNVRIQDEAGQAAGDFDLARGRSSHGWSAVNSVVWNSDAETFSVDSPPTANNWIMGGAAGAKALLGTGTYSAQRGTLQPQSLYRAQLAERLGRGNLMFERAVPEINLPR